MSARTLPDRHVRTTITAPAPSAPGRLSTAGWSRLRRSVTTAVFIVATVAAVAVGVHAVDVSPVAPPVAIGQLAPAVAVQPAAPAVTQPPAPAVVAPTPADNGAGPRPGTAQGPGRGGGGGVGDGGGRGGRR